MTPHIGHLIKLIHDKIRVRADADLRAHDLTLAQIRVLKFLDTCDGVATQKEIEAFLGVSHPTVAGIVARMERSGYLCTETDEMDRRNKLVRMTEKARQYGTQMAKAVDEQEAQILAPLTPEQIEALTSMLIMIYENLNRQDSNPVDCCDMKDEPVGKEK